MKWTAMALLVACAAEPEPIPDMSLDELTQAYRTCGDDIDGAVCRLAACDRFEQANRALMGPEWWGRWCIQSSTPVSSCLRRACTTALITGPDRLPLAKKRVLEAHVRATAASEGWGLWTLDELYADPDVFRSLLRVWRDHNRPQLPLFRDAVRQHHPPHRPLSVTIADDLLSFPVASKEDSKEVARTALVVDYEHTVELLNGDTGAGLSLSRAEIAALIAEVTGR